MHFCSESRFPRRRVYLEPKSLNRRREKTICVKTFRVLGLRAIPPHTPQKKNAPNYLFPFWILPNTGISICQLASKPYGIPPPPLPSFGGRSPPPGPPGEREGGGEIEDVSPRLTYIALLHPPSSLPLVRVRSPYLRLLVNGSLMGGARSYEKRGGRAYSLRSLGEGICQMTTQTTFFIS